jgi:hypothetical protein
MKRFFFGAAAAALFAAGALAGEQYVDATGFAVSGYDVVAYRDLPQAPVGQPQPAPVPGRADITADWNGARFAFASEANRDAFLANPDHYAPQYDGHCAYGVAKGGKAPGNPQLWRIVDDKLYLNVTQNVVGFWEADIPGNLSRSEGNWPAIEPQPATDRAIPGFTPAAPVAD